MNLSWLDDFLALADTLNFSRAAQDRHMTQPAFSRRIRALETWLGTALFDRSAQPVRLTETGMWFRDNAHDLLTRVARLPGDARRVAAAHDSALRFCATHALSLTFLPAWLRGLETDVPDSRFEVVSDVLSHCEDAMLHGRAQFMLCHGQVHVPTRLPASDFDSIVIGHDTLMCVCAPDDKGAPRFPTDNDVTPLLAYSDASGLGRIVARMNQSRLNRSPSGMDTSRAHSVNERVVFTAHLATVLRSMAIDGRGVAYLPRSLIRQDLADGVLCETQHSPSIALEVRLYRPRAPLAARSEALWRAACTLTVLSP